MKKTTRKFKELLVKQQLNVFRSSARILTVSLFLLSFISFSQEYPFTSDGNVQATLNVQTGQKEDFSNPLLGYNLFNWHTTAEKDLARDFNPSTVRFPDGLYANWYNHNTDRTEVFGSETVSYRNRSGIIKTDTIDELDAIKVGLRRGLGGLEIINNERGVNDKLNVVWTFNMSADADAGYGPWHGNIDHLETIKYYNKLVGKNFVVKDIELGNENFYPNQRSSYIPNEEDYIKRARQMAIALKAKDSNIKVSIPLSKQEIYHSPTWNDDVTAGLSSYIDAYTVHTYIGADPDNSANSDEAFSTALTARKFLEASVTYAYTSSSNRIKPIWLTEWGVKSGGPNAVSALGMADCYLYMSDNQNTYHRANWFSVSGKLNSFLKFTTNSSGKKVIKYPLEKSVYGATHEILKEVLEDSEMYAGILTTNDFLGNSGVKAISAKAVTKNGVTTMLVLNMTNDTAAFKMKFNGVDNNSGYTHKEMKFNSADEEPYIDFDISPLTIKSQGSGSVVSLSPLSINVIIFDNTTSSNSQQPYNNVINVPATFEAENYDIGGQGISYNDTSTGNSGGAYRVSDDVDIQTNNTIPRTNVGWMATGEWLEYSINVLDSGSYNFEFTYAANGSNARIGAGFPDENINLFSNFALDNPQGWTTYKTKTKYGTNLNAGNHILRIRIEGDGFNLDKIRIFKPLNAQKSSVKTKISELENNEFVVYPNPSKSGKFILSKSSDWTVYNTIGLKVLEGKGTQVNLSEFSTGVYLLKANNKTKKIFFSK